MCDRKVVLRGHSAPKMFAHFSSTKAYFVFMYASKMRMNRVLSDFSSGRLTISLPTLLSNTKTAMYLRLVVSASSLTTSRTKGTRVRMGMENSYLSLSPLIVGMEDYSPWRSTLKEASDFPSMLTI